MNSRLPRLDRSDRIDYVSRELAPGAALLTRLLARQVVSELSRTEAGLLRTLSGGPRRITELAELEGLAQPTTTLLVQRLEQQRLVAREGDPQDGRVVLVNLTETGSRELDDYRAQASATLRSCLDGMPDEQLEALAAATETLTQLVAVLQQGSIT
jgi:DNA-binding MarR family transcriptional regulator